MGPKREINAVQDMNLHDNMWGLLLFQPIFHPRVRPKESPLTLDILGLW